MPYCPNCSAELKSSTDPVCWNCQAIFTDPTGWQPTEQPAGEFRLFAVKKIPGVEPAASGSSSTEIKVLKAIVTIPLCLFGSILMLFGGGQVGILLWVLALAIWASSTKATKFVSMVLGVVVSVLTLGFFYIIALMLGAK